MNMAMLIILLATVSMGVVCHRPRFAPGVWVGQRLRGQQPAGAIQYCRSSLSTWRYSPSAPTTVRNTESDPWLSLGPNLS